MRATDFDSGVGILTALSKMANVLGHELRNPLAVIQNGVYLLGTILPDADPNIKETLDLVSNQEVNSRVWEGTTFTVRRPRTEQPS